MELRQLEYFVAVAEERGFSRGAERAHVVQSAVSAAVAKLERELDISLLDRTAFPVALTPAGAAFLAEARSTLAAARRARGAVEAYRGQLSGRVDLGILMSAGPLDLSEALGRFHARYPLVAVRLRQSVAGTSGHLAAVAAGELDLALVAATRAPAAVTLRTIAREPIVVLCRPEHRFARRAPGEECDGLGGSGGPGGPATRAAHDGPAAAVGIAELADETVVRFAAGWGSRRQVDEAFVEAGIAPDSPYEVADYDTAAGLVRHRLGVTLMPATPAARYPDLRAIPVMPALTWTLALACAAQPPPTPAARALADALLQSIAPAAQGFANQAASAPSR
jgi:DNA-binding transcriptional LysR family regulator